MTGAARVAVAVVWALLAFAAAACAGAAGPRRVTLALPELNGLSGLDADRDHLLWTVPERERVLVATAGGGVSEELPIEGVSPNVDLEAVAVLGPGRFAFGTESNGAPPGEAGDILLAERRGDAVVVVGSIDLPPSLWQLGRVENQGVEGLCAAAGHLVAALETAGGGDGAARFAPVAVRRLDGRGAWIPHRLRLTTATGKISSLDCRAGEGGALDVVAVERHFGVARVLAFTVPVSGPGGSLEPEVLLDLDAFAGDTGVNLEGIARRGVDLVFAVDNQYKGALSGPNELVVIPGAAR